MFFVRSGLRFAQRFRFASRAFRCLLFRGRLFEQRDLQNIFDMLDEAALEGVRRWHFNWNKSAGAPQPMRVFVPIEFVQHAR